MIIKRRGGQEKPPEETEKEAEQKSVKSERGPSAEEEVREETHVGVRMTPEGKLDYSRALRMFTPEEVERMEKKQRAEKLRIPEEVKPGTAEMVGYSIRNGLFLQSEIVDREILKAGPNDLDEEAVERIKRASKAAWGFRAELSSLLIQAKLDAQAEIIDPALKADEAPDIEKLMALNKLSVEELLERYRDAPASGKLYDVVGGIIQAYEGELLSESEDGEPKENLMAVYDEGEWDFIKYPTEDLLSATANLQRRLATEGARYEGDIGEETEKE